MLEDSLDDVLSDYGDEDDDDEVRLITPHSY